jgi:hypothetical protein
MKWNDRVPITWPIAIVAVLTLLTLTACSSGTTTKAPENEKPAATAQNANGPGINLNLIISRLQNPPDSYHYSYKNTGDPNTTEDEADVTPQTLDGTFATNASDVTKPPVSNKVHAVRSDENGWRMAWESFSGIMKLAGKGGLIVQNAVREGTEKVNGYDTTRYSVDTTRGNAAGNSVMLGQGGFIKGTAWVTSDGCPVKMILDEEIHLRDGSVSKNHFEEAISKK